MTNRNIEEKVNKGFSNATPDMYDTIKNDCKQTTVYRTAPASSSRRTNLWKLATLALALVLVVTALIGGIGTINQTAHASTVSLDVNPSVQIHLNRKGKVVEVEALNADGELIISGMDFENADLNLTINALIGSMLRNGYLSELANSVLVSVDSNKKDVYDQLVATVTEQIAVTLKGADIEASVVSQWIQKDDTVKKIAKDNGISVGKAQIISKIVQIDATYTVEQLVELSVNELSLLLGSLKITDENITQEGTASQKAYIGEQRAWEIALGYVALTADTPIAKKEIKLDFDDGVMLYEIEFEFDGYEYEFEIGAISGSIVSFEKSLDDFYAGNEIAKTEQELIDIVLADAFSNAIPEGITAKTYFYGYGKVTAIRFNHVDENGASTLYEYEISKGGTIISKVIVEDVTDADAYLTRAQVEEKIREKLNLTVLDKLSNLSIHLRENGQTVEYSVSFLCDGIYYTGTVNALTGLTELSATQQSNGNGWGFGGNHDWDDFWDAFEDYFDDFDWNNADKTFTYEYEDGGLKYQMVVDVYGNVISNKVIGECDNTTTDPTTELEAKREEFRTIISKYLGIDLTDVHLVVEIDDDHKNTHYEVEFVVDGYEYEVELRKDGSVLRWDKERAD